MAVTTVSTLADLLYNIIPHPSSANDDYEYDRVKYSEACFIPILTSSQSLTAPTISPISFSKDAYSYPGDTPVRTTSTSTSPYLRIYSGISSATQSSGIFYAAGGTTTKAYACTSSYHGITWFPHYSNNTNSSNLFTGYTRGATVGFWFSPTANALSATTAQIFSICGETLSNTSTTNGRFILAFRSGSLAYLKQDCNSAGSASTASYTTITTSSSLTAANWYYCIASVYCSGVSIYNGTTNYNYLIAVQILNSSGTALATGSYTITLTTNKCLKFVFGSLGMVYSSFGNAPYCQYHSFFLSYGPRCCAATATALTAVAKELMAIRDWYCDYNTSTGTGLTSISKTAFIGCPASPGMAIHGAHLFKLAAGNYKLTMTRSAETEPSYDPVCLYALSSNPTGYSSGTVYHGALKLPYNLFKFTSGSAVQYRRPFDTGWSAFTDTATAAYSHNTWSLVAQTNDASYYGTSNYLRFSLSQATWMCLYGVRDASGGPNYFDCTYNITQEKESDSTGLLASKLSQNATSIGGSLANLKEVNYNNLPVDCIKYSTKTGAVWGRPYQYKIFAINYAAGLTTSLGGPYGSATTGLTALGSATYSNTTTPPKTPLKPAYFTLSRCRYIGEDSQSGGGVETNKFMCMNPYYEKNTVTYGSTTYYSGMPSSSNRSDYSEHSYWINGVTCTGANGLFGDAITFTAGTSAASTSDWRPFVYEEYSESIDNTASFDPAVSIATKLSRQSCSLGTAASVTKTLDGCLYEGSVCTNYYMGYAPIAFFVRYTYISTTGTAVRLQVYNYQSEAITIATVAGKYSYINPTLGTSEISTTITSGNSVTVSAGGVAYLTLGTLASSSYYLATTAGTADIILSACVGSGTKSYIRLYNPSDTLTMAMWGLNYTSQDA